MINSLIKSGHLLVWALTCLCISRTLSKTLNSDPFSFQSDPLLSFFHSSAFETSDFRCGGSAPDSLIESFLPISLLLWPCRSQATSSLKPYRSLSCHLSLPSSPQVWVLPVPWVLLEGGGKLHPSPCILMKGNAMAGWHRSCCDQLKMGTLMKEEGCS